MSRTITLTVSDEVYAALRRRAEAEGISPTHVAATSLERRFGHAGPEPGVDRLSGVASQQAEERRFARHFGAVNLGRTTGADNESIDADLARQYADTRESA